MRHIVGTYSQLPFAASIEDYETLLHKQLKPLLTMIYQNQNFKLLLRLGMNVFEYIENNHPEINMLINDLCRKNQVELLTSSCFDTVLSLVPVQDRSQTIEKTTTFLRKRFGKHANGLWCYCQIFTPAIIPMLNLCDLNYIVISSFNHSQNTSLISKPFYMDEMGKSTVVFPSDDRFSKIVSEYSKNPDSYSERIVNDFEKAAASASNITSIAMINLDQLKGCDKIPEIFSVLYNSFGNSCTLPSDFLRENNVKKSFYLPAGLYGRDFNPGKAVSINQIIIDSPMLNRHFSLLNTYRDIVKSCKKNSDERKHLDCLLQKASSASLYIPEFSDNPAILNSVNKNLCETESILESIKLLPEDIVMNSDRNKSKIMASKNLICYLDTVGAVISRFSIPAYHYDLCFNCGNGFFSDLIRNSSTSKTTDISQKKFELTSLDKKSQDIFAKCPTVEIDRIPLNITKRFKLRQNTAIADIGIENIGNTALKNNVYECCFDLSLPFANSVALSGSETLSETPVEGNRTIISHKNLPLTFDIFTSDKAFFSRKDVFVQNEKQNSAQYRYTRIKLSKKINIDSMEELHFTIAIKIEKNTRRQS